MRSKKVRAAHGGSTDTDWMHIDRRRFCGVLAGGVAATVLPLAARGESAAAPTLLEAGEAQLHLAPGGETAVWAYGGQVPGPLVRVKLGEKVQVRLANKLERPTTLCWHGVRIANAMDGVAGLTQPAVAPGASLDYSFTPPDAGLFWYHPHVFPHSAEQIGRGLYGALIVDAPDAPKVDADVLLVIDDWSLDAKGAIAGNFVSLAEARGVGAHRSARHRQLEAGAAGARGAARGAAAATRAQRLRGAHRPRRLRRRAADRHRDRRPAERAVPAGARHGAGGARFALRSDAGRAGERGASDDRPARPRPARHATRRAYS